MKFFLHLRKVLKHKKEVFRACFACGLIWQGITHDLSKFSPSEFWTGVKYYQGFRSPNDMQRQEVGYSLAWLKHKGKNLHHLEFWMDYNPENGGKYSAIEMPLPYVVESVCDRIAASKSYEGEMYSDSSSLDYYLRSRSNYIIHDNTDAYFLKYLQTLAKEGEKSCFAVMKNDLQAEKQRKENSRTKLK